MKGKYIWLAGLSCIVVVASYFLFFPKSTTTLDSHSSVSKGADSIALSQLRWLDSAEANTDCQRAILRRDFRFFGIYGYAPYLPGVQRSDDSLLAVAGVRFSDSSVVAIAGVRYIDGTSDMLLSKEHARLNHLAGAYALQYNRLLLQYFRERKAN